MTNFRHQGDVTFISYSGEKGEKLNHNGTFVLALGKTSGHRHVITVERPDQMEVSRLPTGEYVLTLTSQATVTHEEHGIILIEPGTYRVGKEREFDHFLNVKRSVID